MQIYKLTITLLRLFKEAACAISYPNGKDRENTGYRIESFLLLLCTRKFGKY